MPHPPPGLAALNLAVPGLQVLSLAVTAAGFIVMYRQLRGISRQIESLAGHLRGIDAKIDAVLDGMDARRHAELEIALDESARAERTSDTARLVHARRTLAIGWREHLHLLESLFARQQAHGEPGALAALLQRASLLAAATARCDWQIEGAAAAEETLRSASRELREAKANFEAPLHVPLDPKIGDATRIARMREPIRAIRECLDRLDGFVAQIALSTELGYSFAEWHALASTTSAGPIVILSSDA